MNKKILRSELRNILKSYAKKRLLTLNIIEYFLKKKLLINFKNLYYNYEKLQKCKIISLYYPLNYEIDCIPIINWLLKINVTVVLPKIIHNTKILKFFEFNKNVVMKKNFMGIKESTAKVPMIPEAIIMPVISFDIQGYRLGQGGGYYDKTIYEMKKFYPLITIGLSYSWQEVKNFYRDVWDTKVDAIVTEKFYKLF